MLATDNIPTYYHAVQ